MRNCAASEHRDQVIGFPVVGRPDYDTLEPLFFEKFHVLAMRALDDNISGRITGQ